MNATDIADRCFSALNGLGLAWNLANVRDDAERARLQAPINAAMLAVYEMWAAHEEGVDLEWARQQYGTAAR